MRVSGKVRENTVTPAATATTERPLLTAQAGRSVSFKEFVARDFRNELT